jgi:transposase InsO family protein
MTLATEKQKRYLTDLRKRAGLDLALDPDLSLDEAFRLVAAVSLVHRQSWLSRRDLSSAVFDYIEAFYDRQRRHSTLGSLSPGEYENTTITTTKET